MLVGRFLLIIPVLAIAGSLARKQPVPPSRARSRPTPARSRRCSSASIVIVVGLTYFPVLALGPIVEHALSL